MATLLRVGVAPDPFLNPECVHGDDLVCDPGVELTLIHVIAKILNVTLKIVLSEQSDKGRLQGLYELMLNGTIDMTGNSFIPTFQRLKFLDVSLPLQQHRQAFLVKRPLHSRLHLQFNPFAPFSVLVWLVLVIFFLAISTAIAIKKYANVGTASAMTSLQLAVTEVRNSWFQYRSPPSHLIWFCGLIFMAALKLAYSSYIWATLLYAYPTQPPFRNIVELGHKLKAHHYRFGTYRGAVMLSDFTCLNVTTCEMFLDSVNDSLTLNFDSWPTPTMLLSQLTKTDDLVYFGDRSALMKYVNDFEHRDQLMLIEDECVTLRFRCFMWKKNFTLADPINQAITFLEDFKDSLRHRFLYGKGETAKGRFSSVDDTRPLSIGVIQGPLLSLGLFFVIACCAFCAEIFWNRRTRKLCMH